MCCDDCDWTAFLEELDEMQEDEKFEFALDYLEKAAKWVGEHGHVTEKQKTAVENIKRAGTREQT
jgi:hypothetical protein